MNGTLSSPLERRSAREPCGGVATAIINPPESAILAVGAVLRVAVVTEDDGIHPGHRMKVTLSSDHRVVDGATAAQYLAEVRRLLENPVSLFV